MASKSHLDLLLLTVLSGESQHGYGLITSLRDESGGQFDYAEGTVYPALHRLEADGLVISTSGRVDGRVRRVYTLTSQGRAAALERAATWRQFCAGVESVLRTAEVSP